MPESMLYKSHSGVPVNTEDLWVYNFHKYAADIKNRNINLRSYEESIAVNITNNLENRGVDYSKPLVFPVVFHLLLDNPAIVSPNTNIEGVQLDTLKIIRDVNKAFSNTGIMFSPVAKDLDGNILETPGLDIIDASEYLQPRGYKSTGQTKNSVHSYTESGLAVSNIFVSPQKNAGRGPKNILPLDGVALESMLSKYTWNEDQVINIFLINSFSQTFLNPTYIPNGLKTPVCISGNPFLYDSARLRDPSYRENYFNIVMPLWALGNPYVSEQEPGYGYKYIETASTPNAFSYLNTTVYNILQDTEGDSTINIYGSSNNKSRPLIKSLGHLFGLANTVNFLNAEDISDTNARNSVCSYIDGFSTCFYEDFRNKSALFAGDCCADVSGPKDIFSTKIPDVSNRCDQRDIYLNYMDPTIVDSQDVVNMYRFSQDQILRMHANINLEYYDTESNVSYQGVLQQLLNSPLEMYNFAIISCEDESTLKTFLNLNSENETYADIFSDLVNTIINI